MIKYKAMSHRGLIEKVEIEKETDKFVYTERGREAKVSEWNCFANTLDEAKQWLIRLKQNEIDKAENNLANRKLEMKILIDNLSKQQGE